jgi:hypothetical protein
MLFFSQLAEELDGASAKVLELIDAECRELLGLAGMRIFSNIQRLRPHLNLEEVLRRPSPPPPGTPDREAVSSPGELLQRRHLRLRRVRQRGSQGRQSDGFQHGYVLELQPWRRR